MKQLNKPILCGVCGIPCGIPCGVKSLIYMVCAVCAVSIALALCAPVHTRACLHAHTHTRLHTAHTAHTAHAPIHAGLRVFAYRTTSPTYRTKEKMDCKTTTRVIRCTPDNVKEMNAVVKNCPALHDLVKSLQDQNLFPGLRALKITLTGPASFTAQGLAAIQQINAPKGD